MNSNLTLRCTVALLAAGCCTTALADEVLPSKAVSYADLNLKSPEGVDALYKRIRRAAVEVCEMPQGTLQLRIEAEIKACRIDATDRAIVSANLPQLNALHLAKTGRNLGTSQYAGRR
jgi:UrcA family protein